MVLSRLALVVSLAMCVYFLFGPTGTMCTISTSSPEQVCRSTTFFEIQGDRLFPALYFIAAWTLAPALAVIGTWPPRRNVALVALAAIVEISGIVSLGGGILWAITAGPLLLFALAATLRR